MKSINFLCNIFHITLGLLGLLVVTILYIGYKQNADTLTMVIILVVAVSYSIVMLVAFQQNIEELKRVENRQSDELIKNYNQGLRNAITICETEGAKDILDVGIPKQNRDGTGYTQTLSGILKEILEIKARENETNSNT